MCKSSGKVTVFRDIGKNKEKLNRENAEWFVSGTEGNGYDIYIDKARNAVNFEHHDGHIPVDTREVMKDL